MVALLVRHDPTGGVRVVIVDLMLREVWLKRNIKKELMLEKELSKEAWGMAMIQRDGRTKHRDAMNNRNRPTQ